MSDEIMISIECLVYNHEKYLRRCLDGFIAQDTKYRFEVLVHDDASKDSSQSIIMEYAKKYPKIIVPLLEKENQYSKGTIQMNEKYIYPHVRGKYFAICEGDDYWIDIHKLEKQVDFLEEHPDYSFTFHNAGIISKDGKETGKTILPNMGIKNPYWKQCDHEVTMQEIIRMGFIPTASIIARTTFILNRRYFCDNPVCGDLPLRLSLCIDGKGFYFNSIMSVYRTGNSESASGVARKNYNNYLKTIQGQELILKNFDEFTQYKWHDEVMYDIKRRKASCYMQFCDKDAIKRENLKLFIHKEMSKKDRLIYGIHLILGNKFEKLRTIKRNILK
ncbi:glycosyltransferase family 2 protein [bacterium 210702-DFI.5.13]|nr:glycosyltransferase family 2 protein [bacterium 210702-DFI.5.13]